MFLENYDVFRPTNEKQQQTEICFYFSYVLENILGCVIFRHCLPTERVYSKTCRTYSGDRPSRRTHVPYPPLLVRVLSGSTVIGPREGYGSCNLVPIYLEVPKHVHLTLFSCLCRLVEIYRSADLVLIGKTENTTTLNLSGRAAGRIFV